MWSQKAQGEMPIPNSVKDDPKAHEILRTWIAHEKLHLAFSPKTWEDPFGWGIMLVDLMKHLARAYEAEGAMKFQDALARVRAGLDAEWEAPTDQGTTEPNRTN